MKQVCILPVLFALAAIGASDATAQDVAAIQTSTRPLLATLPPTGAIQTRLRVFILPAPATEEGYATVRVLDEEGASVYRGMKLLAAGTRTLDLSAVSIPAAGRYTLHVVYPGGTLVQELPILYTPPAAAGKEMSAGR